MKAHLLDESGVILQTIVVESLDFMPNLVDASIGGTMGDTVIDGELFPKEPEVIIPPVPLQVSRRQARQALLLAGLLDKVPLAIATITDTMQREMATIEWEDSLTFDRYRPLVVSIAHAVGLDDSKLDDLFRLAATL